MQILTCILLGYLLGSLNPAALLAKLTRKDFRAEGTGNLGATNTMLILGKGFGALVMLFDLLKAALAVRMARRLFPFFAAAGLLTGTAAVAGHIFPFYLKFKGGKGLAAYGGLVLAYDWRVFLILLVIACILVLAVNYSYIMPFFGATVFPLYVGFTTQDLGLFALAATAGLLIFVKHFGNYRKAKAGDDHRIRDFFRRAED